MSKKKQKPQQEQQEVPTKGALLKAAREERGLSLELVHEATKIPMDALRAIEEGYTVRMLSDFYHKGFLKIYANYLGVDISEVVDDYRKEKLPKYIKKDVEEFNLSYTISDFLSSMRNRQIVAAIGAVIVVFVLFKFVFVKKESKSSKAKAKVVQKAPVKKQVPKPKPAPKPTPRPAAPAPVAAPAPKPAQPAAVKVESTRYNNVTLTIRAKEKTWLRVLTDGDVVFQSGLREGAVETWIANKEIEISGKNISQLEFELNGKMIGSLGREDRKAKRLIVTKDGLSVTK